MSRHHAHLETAATILDLYEGEEPFAAFLKKYFAPRKKHGSTDRKIIAHLCYCYFRLGKLWPELDDKARILAGLFLCTREKSAVLESLQPDLHKDVFFPVTDKFVMLNDMFGTSETPASIFPPGVIFSPTLDKENFNASFFRQPSLFLRLRPGFEETVKEKLQVNNIAFKKIDDHCLAFDNAVKLDKILEPDRESVIQDLSSQQISSLFKIALQKHDQPLRAWDCCAGSGGKSILLFDLDNTIRLTVSDIRTSILANLEKRFEVAGIKDFKSGVFDLTTMKVPNDQFDLVICDAPCTGSGTWSRTPEQLYFFEEEAITHYRDLQEKISQAAVKALKPGGFLIYITCSVFKKENEEVVEKITANPGYRLMEKKLLQGSSEKADTMFGAVIQKIRS
jgi:16S rRNA (cytosine967-C5)-methyltransferase